jgi:hypothetical protein
LPEPEDWKMETSKDSENIDVIVILAVIIIMALSVFQFIISYKYCDNHFNWLNHDYCKNLMVSTEEDSIFMTEGGDNQVFGTLYFTYAEKLRPDLTPYDQKGNIFKKIYGDMRYISDPDTLPRRMNLVDQHIFESEQPFYENIRESRDPFFIPYWQGVRPVYLTWQRPEPWNLGDYYYKRYGLMYKVQNIEYELVDFLELKKSITVKEAQQQFSLWLHRQVDMSFTLSKIAEMGEKNYLKTSNGRVYFVRMYPAPHEGDYFDNLLIRWHSFPNAMYWDSLSREIIINYDYTMGEIYREKINELIDMRNNETRKDILAEINKRINENWQKAKEFYNDALIYGNDFNATLHNIAVVYLHNGIENLDEKARELLTRALTLYKNQYSTYYVTLTFLIDDCFKNPSHENENIRDAEKWIAQLNEEIMHYRSESTRDSILKNFEGLERFVSSLKEVPTSQLVSEANAISENLIHDPASVDVNQAENVVELLYSRGLPFQYQPYIKEADEIFDKLIELKKNDYNYMARAFSVAFQTQKLDKAYNIGKILELNKKNGIDPTFNYYMGVICYYLHKNSEALFYLNSFIDTAEGNKEIMMKASEMLKNSQDIIKQIKEGNNPR